MTTFSMTYSLKPASFTRAPRRLLLPSAKIPCDLGAVALARPRHDQCRCRQSCPRTVLGTGEVIRASLLATGFDAGQRARFVFLNEPAIADHIGGHYGGQAPPWRLFRHSKRPPMLPCSRLQTLGTGSLWGPRATMGQ